nr:MAG TPA: hypothetical protein [Caudoviricetes sp.]
MHIGKDRKYLVARKMRTKSLPPTRTPSFQKLLARVNMR